MRGSSAVKILRLAALAGTSLGVIGAAPAAAQVSSEPQEEQAGTPNARVTEEGLQEIVVTAERRATNLQDTPLSIVAVTEEAIAAKGIEDLQDLSTFTPNLSISASRGNGNNVPNFTIRGISGGGGATGERGVGLYIDGVYVPRTSGSVLRVLDIDRIEVLRGPQGTLFGRNSTGGAIRIFSKQPDDEFDGYVRGTVGSFDRTDLIGMLNVPLTDTLAVRLQGAYLNQDGFVSRGTQNLGGTEDVIGRIVARWEPSRDANVTVAFLYSDSKADGTPLVFREFDMRPGIEGIIQGNVADWLNDSFKRAGQAPLAAFNDPRIVTGDPFRAPNLCLLDDFDPDYDDVACRQFNDNKYWQADITTEFQLAENVTVSTVTGLSKLEHVGVSDFQLLGLEARRDDTDSEVFYTEVQLNTSLFGDVIDVVTGANYFKENAFAPNFIVQRRGTSAFPASPGTPPDSDAGLFRTVDTVTDQESNSFGVFLNGTWHITDALDLTGGLRYSHDKKDYLQTRFAELLPNGAPGAFRTAPGTNSTTVQDDSTFEQIDYRATIDYDFTSDIMAYATVSKAYKAGIYSYTIQSFTAANNATGPNQSAVIQPVPPEQVQNFEAGSRMTLFNRRVRFNPTVFYMKYTNRQAARQVACSPPGAGSCPTTGFSINLVDSGDVDIWGGELDMQIAVTDNFILDASGAILSYEVKDPVANSGPNLFPDAPSPTFNVGATYNADLGFGPTTFNLNYAHVGEQETHPTDVGDSAYRLPSYSLVNARIQFVPNDGPLTLVLFANNLLDNTYATYAQRFGGGFWDAASGVGPAAPPRSALGEVRGRPREIGLSAQFNF
jgi:iron complex outermembrane receptor protein